ncbi:DUF4214 domain-containing protein [Marimonas sp. MJW-29]|uniref:DUF4214 domain-containing protein n=1 Tax=Sulfitobacter sediminis TaxID=3234186 RepID=A0ABV3RKW7_9RHOB
MPGPAAAIGLYAAGLGIYSFFSGFSSDVERQFEMSQLKNDLAELQGITTAVINQNIAQSLGAADTALDQLELYAASEDAAARATFANNAVLESSNALNAVVSQVLAGKGSASAESLAYMMGALQYAVLVRQTVANTVQDGPLGGAGLHQSIKQATQLMYDTVGGNDIYSEFPRAISSRIEVDGLDVNFFGTKVNFSVVSSFSGRSEAVEVVRDSGFADTFPFLPYVESDASFERRADAAADAAFNRIYSADYAEARVSEYLSLAVEMNTWLAQDAVNVPELYERIGTSGADTEQGTNNADYFSGLAGDDILSGANGPDALNGGSGNDILRGGALQDVLTGGLGNDLIFGSERMSDGIDGDTARFAGLSSDYTVVGGSTYAVVTGPDGARDKLFNIEFLRFDDTYFALGEGSALDSVSRDAFTVEERVALLYEAALDRNGAIDLPGLNFYIEVTERDNLSNEFLAADLMTSPEFTAKFGDVNTLSNDAFLEQIYLNVLDRASDGAGKAFYLGLLDSGTITRALALADIATSPENSQGSADILMGLYESSTGDWSFVSDGMEIA